MRQIIVTIMLTVVLSSAGFAPNFRIDHEDRTNHGCFHVMLTLGPTDAGPQPVYAAFEDDSFAGILIQRQDVCFQKSTDGGRTWLESDVLIQRGARFACYPDLTTDRAGNIYLVYTERTTGSSGHIWAVRSTDQGNTWSLPVRVDDNISGVNVGWARIAADSAGWLFVAWNDLRGPYLRIWSSVSTDGGLTWQPNVRVDDDTVSFSCYSPDVFIQPGTRQYLVTFPGPVRQQPQGIVLHALIARSTDQGRSFQPCVILDTFQAYAQQPHIVADRNWVICDYTGNSGGNRGHSQDQLSSDQGVTWSDPIEMTELGELYNSYANGAHLAIDPEGNIHTGLLICDSLSWNYEIYYAYSTDHGFTWSERELVNDVLTEQQQDPDIACDAAGNVYLAWQDRRNGRNEIWFATNNPLVAGPETPQTTKRIGQLTCTPSLFRTGTRIPVPACTTEIRIYNPAGRLVRRLAPDTRSWDGRDISGRRCPPGIYLVTLARAGSAPAKAVLLE